MNAKKGIIALTAVTVLAIGFTYFGNFTVSKEQQKTEMSHAHDEGISFDDFEREQISLLNKEDQSSAQAILTSLERSPDAEERAAIAHHAVSFWSEHSPELAAYYHYVASDIENNAEGLVFAADQLFVLFRTSQKIEIKNNLINFAALAYESALKLTPNDNTLKIKTGETFLEGMIQPMKGVALLKEVAEQEPENVQAHTLLGRFSLMSGQYDKAKENLDRALSLNPTHTEAIYFMAFTQEGLGNNDKAVELFELLKQMIDDPEFHGHIDEIIVTLK